MRIAWFLQNLVLLQIALFCEYAVKQPRKPLYICRISISQEPHQAVRPDNRRAKMSLLTMLAGSCAILTWDIACFCEHAVKQPRKSLYICRISISQESHQAVRPDNRRAKMSLLTMLAGSCAVTEYRKTKGKRIKTWLVECRTGESASATKPQLTILTISCTLSLLQPVSGTPAAA